MLRFGKSAALLLTAGMFYVMPAHGQATRTWVSGVGDDVNPCSRTAPCKTFAGAISKTAAGGEINCLDPGGFGAVNIIKSMTISCPYTEGGALAGGNGITVNLPSASDVVFLRGLDIFGVNPPTNGVRFIAQGTLHIEDTTIRRFNAVNSQGISFQPSGAAELYLHNVTVAENGNGVTGGGILIQPTGAGGSARVVMINVRAHNNANNGLFINTTGNTAAAGIIVDIERSSFSGNTTGIAMTTPPATTSATALITDSTVSMNSGTGIVANGGTATARLNNSTVTGNALGLNPAGGSQINSFGTNRVIGNTDNGVFTGAVINPN